VRLMKALVFGCLLAVSSLAIAQTVPGSLSLGWTLPTTGCTVGVSPCDNTPLTGARALTGVQVWISTAPIPDNFAGAPTLTLSGASTTASHTINVPNGTRLYARLKAVNAQGTSPFSTQVDKVIDAPVAPGVPTQVTINIEIGSAE
jgi:hypothetical protein